MTSVALTSPLTSLASRLAIHRDDPLWAGDGHKGSEDPQAGEDWEILTQWPMRLEDKKHTVYSWLASHIPKKNRKRTHIFSEVGSELFLHLRLRPNPSTNHLPGFTQYSLNLHWIIPDSTNRSKTNLFFKRYCLNQSWIPTINGSYIPIFPD